MGDQVKHQMKFNVNCSRPGCYTRRFSFLQLIFLLLFRPIVDRSESLNNSPCETRVVCGKFSEKRLSPRSSRVHQRPRPRALMPRCHRLKIGSRLCGPSRQVTSHTFIAAIRGEARGEDVFSVANKPKELEIALSRRLMSYILYIYIRWFNFVGNIYT
jgi:hypothetical protein